LHAAFQPLQRIYLALLQLAHVKDRKFKIRIKTTSFRKILDTFLQLNTASQKVLRLGVRQKILNFEIKSATKGGQGQRPP